MISGFFVENEIPTKQIVLEETTVRVMKQSAQPFSRNIILKGSAEADKNVQLRAETSGQVIGLPVAQGQFVKKVVQYVKSLSETKTKWQKKLL